MYRVLKCSKCNKVIINPYMNNLKRNDSFPLYHLRKYLKDIGINNIRINKIVDNVYLIDGKYNKCCSGYDIIQDQEADKSPSSTHVMDVLYGDAYKDDKGGKYMDDLYDGYSAGWNKEDDNDE